MSGSEVKRVNKYKSVDLMSELQFKDNLQVRTQDFRMRNGACTTLRVGPHADGPLAGKAAGAVLSILGALSPRMALSGSQERT